MNFGREMGRVGRWMCRPVSWWVVGLGVVGMLMVAWVSRWPVGGAWPWFSDLGFYRPGKGWTWSEWRARVGWEGVVYVLGLSMWVAVVVAWWVGALMQGAAVWVYRPPGFQRVGGRWRHWMLFACFVPAVLGVGVGGPYRLGKVWAREIVRARDMTSVAGSSMFVVPVIDPGLRDDARVAALRSAARYGSTPRERLTAVREMVIWYPAHSAQWLVQAEREEKDLATRALLLRLIGMYRKAEVGGVLEGRLDDPRPEIRVAAADGLGFLHGYAYAINEGDDGVANAATISDPPIHVWSFRRSGRGNERWGDEDWERGRRIAMPEGRRGKLMGMMLGGGGGTPPSGPPLNGALGVTLEEREAAARALLPWPAEGYKLRVAEWGVWVAEGAGLRPAKEKAVIPPFVYSAGSSDEYFEGRLDRAYEIRKPVVHLTASTAMAVDVEVRIRDGRPWYVYPRPDDYSVMGGRSQLRKALAWLEPGPVFPKGSRGLSDLRTGYPWLAPRSPTVSGDGVAGVGVRWQSVIVSPSKFSWMSEAAVPAGAEYAWWKRLREVECSWLSSRGESERFLYYDGPTRARLPVDLERAGEALVTRPSRVSSTLLLPAWEGRSGDVPGREALRLRVSGGRVVLGERIRVPMSTLGPTAVEVRETLAGGRVEGAFLSQVRGMGLTESEAGGMVECWRREWFETDGERVLLFLEGRDYELFCPMRVRPAPTEVVRVGVVWVEL